MKSRRSDLQLTCDILNAVSTRMEKLAYQSGGPAPTTYLSALTLSTNISYDKLKERVTNLEKVGLLTTKPLAITERGYLFLQEFDAHEKVTKRLNDYIIPNLSTDQEKALLPVGIEHQIKETQQVINAQNAIINELESK